MSKENKDNSPERSHRFVTAKSLIDLSGLETSVQDDAFQVALARALYIKQQLVQGKPIERYEGRHRGTIEVATQSILQNLDKS